MDTLLGTPISTHALWLQEELQRGTPLRDDATRVVEAWEQVGRRTSNLAKMASDESGSNPHGVDGERDALDGDLDYDCSLYFFLD